MICPVICRHPVNFESLRFSSISFLKYLIFHKCTRKGNRKRVYKFLRVSHKEWVSKGSYVGPTCCGVTQKEVGLTVIRCGAHRCLLSHGGSHLFVRLWTLTTSVVSYFIYDVEP